MTQSEPIQAEKGLLDLSSWDINENIKLDGEWEFYWNRLLSYRDLQEEKPDLLADVPNVWNVYTLNSKKLPGEGCATYRLHIKTNLSEGTLLGLRAYAFSSAYNLYINEKLVASNGQVSAEAAEEIGEYKPQTIFFNTPAKDFDIIIHVSNFQYARGGFWYNMFMGSPEGILNFHDNAIGKEIFLVGTLIIVSLFFFAVYILERGFKYCLYFSCLCMFMVVGLDMLGQFILVRSIPNIPLTTVIFIWYSSVTWAIFFVVIFVHELFQSRFSKFAVRIFLVSSILFQLLYIFTDPRFYTRLAAANTVFEIMGLLSAVIIVAIGIKKGYKDGWLNILCMLIVLVAYIHDTLFWTNRIMISYGEIIYGGLFLSVFLQMVIQAQRIKLFQEQKTAAELAFLQAQIKPHFLYNALNTFISISHYDIDNARKLLTDFSSYLRRSFDFKDLSQFVPLKNEIELAKAYIEIEKARFEERIEAVFDVPDDLEVRVPTLMLQPLIENAVIHGILPKAEGGRIDIFIGKEGRTLIFKVKDNGIGIAAEKLNRIMKNDLGKGVGLANINKRLKKLYVKGLNINSSPGTGTEITWSIPINNRRIDQ